MKKTLCMFSLWQQLLSTTPLLLLRMDSNFYLSGGQSKKNLRQRVFHACRLTDFVLGSVLGLLVALSYMYARRAWRRI